MIQNAANLEIGSIVKKEGGRSHESSDELMPPTQSFDPLDTGPRLKVEGLIWNAVPENVMETWGSELQGTFQMPISLSISEITTHKHTGPGPVAGILRARDCGVHGLYTLGATDNQGAASVNNSTLATDNRIPVDRDTVERALPEALKISLSSVNRMPHPAAYLLGHRHISERAIVAILVRPSNEQLRI